MTYSYSVGGMHCAACSARVERVVKAILGISSANVNLETATLTAEGAPGLDGKISEAIENAGFEPKKVD